ncbi:MAG: hypothetical protein VB010_07145 [Sphaerochaeta associata]|jgi:hypothetical protein|uniref:hypothetical protein n=1 Tax=Sphaerochaeta associata TaxID=1129264 RepID=UPI002B1FA3BE|nr:hypothetical protein [Sphaerochaeta associata]MEA5107114.1 hypothetical protein [Sphaerochaeta associata]
MILSSEEKDCIHSLICSALDNLYIHDLYLIRNKVNERSIVNRFSIYFQEKLSQNGYADYNLDVEYNKDHSNLKRTINFPRGTYPDVIVHKRGSNEYNLCIIEFKPWWRSNTDRDILKLRDFSNQEGDYGYGIGLSIILSVNAIHIKTIVNGVVVESTQRNTVRL